jgi:hypothetical protein
MRLDAGQSLIDHKRIGAVAANQPMLAKQPNIAKLAYRDGWRLRRFVRVRQSSILVERERRYFVGAITDQIEVEVDKFSDASIIVAAIAPMTVTHACSSSTLNSPARNSFRVRIKALATLL